MSRAPSKTSRDERSIAVEPVKPGKPWSPDGSRFTSFVLALPLIVILLVFVSWPFVQLVEKSLSGPDGWRSYTNYFGDEVNVRAFGLTFVVSLIVTVMAVTLGAVLAWAMRATQSRALRFVLWTAVLLPMWMGIIVKNYAFLVVLGRRGVINELLQHLHLAGQPLDLLYTPFAVVVGMLYTVLPYAVLPLYASFVTIPLELPQAAESLGATRSRAIRTVVLPLAVPGLLATSFIVFVLCLGFYLTPVILGGPSSTMVASLIQADVFQRFDPVSAATAGTLLIVLAVVVLVIAWKVVGGERLKKAIA